MTSDVSKAETRHRLDPDRSLSEPHPRRLALDHPDRAQILAAHDEARAAGRIGYPDPATGRFVVCANYLADRGWCCGCGCRHCPYVVE